MSLLALHCDQTCIVDSPECKSVVKGSEAYEATEDILPNKFFFLIMSMILLHFFSRRTSTSLYWAFTFHSLWLFTWTLKWSKNIIGTTSNHTETTKMIAHMISGISSYCHDFIYDSQRYQSGRMIIIKILIKYWKINYKHKNLFNKKTKIIYNRYIKRMKPEKGCHIDLDTMKSVFQLILIRYIGQQTTERFPTIGLQLLILLW